MARSFVDKEIKNSQWIADFLARSRARASYDAGTRSIGGSAGIVAAPVLLEADERRVMVEAMASEDVAHFKTTALGGAWTLAHMGVACDAYKAFAATKQAQTFCRAFGLNLSWRMVATAGVNSCVVCCQYWCAKKQHYFSFLDSRGRSLTRAQLAAALAFEEPPAFTALYLLATEPLLGRMRALRLLVA